jgi:predicted molibdopterin-dependent oxidoreductase YjgC
MIASELAARLGGDLGVGSAADLWDEIERLAPSHAGLTRAVLDSPAARDGVVVPLKASRVTIGKRGTNWDSKFDPMATPGIESVEVQGAVARVGAAESQGSYESEAGEQTTERSGVLKDTEPDKAHPKKPSMLSFTSLSFTSSDKEPSEVQSVEPAGEPGSGSLMLVSPRRLYDQGVQMLESESLVGLVKPLVAKVNPAELEFRSIAPGSIVRLGSNSTAFEIEVVADAGVHRGMVEVSANVRTGDGEQSAASLIKSGNNVTDVRLEPT